MNKIIGMRGLHFLAGSALLMVVSLAQAQYVWVDEKGVKQFSDRSPPSNIPTKNILKAPRGQASASSESDASAAAAAPAPGNSLAEREADYKKRQLARADADKKAASESASANLKKAVCDSARAAKAQLDSGVRLRAGANGEYMEDKERGQQAAVANKTLADCQ
jgi:hypothetical protein